jgi:hypothetical protein
MFGRQPAFGLFMRHVVDLSLSDVNFKAPLEESRPDIVVDDIVKLRIARVRE